MFDYCISLLFAFYLCEYTTDSVNICTLVYIVSSYLPRMLEQLWVKLSVFSNFCHIADIPRFIGRVIYMSFTLMYVFALRIHVTFMKGHSTRKSWKCKVTVEHMFVHNRLTRKAHTLLWVTMCLCSEQRRYLYTKLILCWDTFVFYLKFVLFSLQSI